MLQFINHDTGWMLGRHNPTFGTLEYIRVLRTLRELTDEEISALKTKALEEPPSDVFVGFHCEEFCNSGNFADWAYVLTASVARI